jgi:phage tail-like protein
MACELSQPQPRSPLRNFQFHIYLTSPSGATRLVGGVQRVSGLTSSITAYEIWEGGNNLHRYAHPDKVNWDSVTLEQGMALDDSLEQWARGVQYFAKTGSLDKQGTADVPVKRDVIIEIHDPVMGSVSGQPSPQPQRCRSYTLHNAWISKYTALPRLDALGSEIALVLVEMIHEGWSLNPPS